MSNVFRSKKVINYMRQAANLERLLCKSKFMPVEENFHVTFCGKNCAWCPYLLKASSYLFKRMNKVFFFKKKRKFNFGSRNLIYVLFIYFIFVKPAKKSVLARLAVWQRG